MAFTPTAHKPEHPFNVWINPDTMEKANMYAAEAVLQKSSEIGGFARIEEHGQDVFVTDIFIPKQNATGGTFNITPQMDQEFMMAMIKAGKREELPMWKSIFHSHPVGMGPSMSGVDVDAIQRRAEGSECYSLILGASREADSDRIAMHYCCTIGGKNLMFRNMPVSIGWDTDRRDKADEVAGLIAAEFGAKTKSDLQQIRDAIRSAICNDLPPTFEEQRQALRKQIAAEVQEKVTAPARHSYRGGFKPVQSSKSTSLVSTDRINGRVNLPYGDQSDLEKAWKNAQRLFAIGYDLIDPDNPDPMAYVTKDAARKARSMHRKLMVEVNTKLREIGGVGMGDLVTATFEAASKDPTLADICIDPMEVDDFQIKNGMISYDVNGSILWPDEIEVMSKYEDIMDWSAMTAAAEAEHDAELEIA